MADSEPISTEPLASGKPSARLPVTALVPSLITILGLCFGLFSLKFAVHDRWKEAVACIIFAAFIDGIDGRVARILNASSKFGAELDSLSDFLNFAVAPAFISYVWLTHSIKGVGWGVAIFFIICGAIRLARFNVSSADKKCDAGPMDEARIKVNHFEGMPSPAAGLLCLAPLMTVFFQEDRFHKVYYVFNGWQMTLYMFLIAVMMVSNLPTVSLKGLNIPRRYVSIVMALFSVAMIALILEPWIGFPIVGACYLLTIPVMSLMAASAEKE
ncbi:MAG: phosphatidylcholine/phosphatidylserine synthase [Rickettsiales bacterium]